MTNLPADLESQLVIHNRLRNDAAGARKALENAVEYQACMVADGLLADMLINGRSMTSLSWWQQYLSHEHPSHIIPEKKDPAFRAFRQKIAQRIATGQIMPINLNSFEELPIRIYGGQVRFVDDVRINQQLQSLGSSLRLLVVGSSRQSRIDQAWTILGKTLKSKSVPDGRFIFGRIGPVSIHWGYQLFQFEREIAVSPYMEADASGFTDEERIIVRPTQLRMTGDQDISLKTQHVRVHETIHTTAVNPRLPGNPNVDKSYQSALRLDLIRFAIKPRKFDDFHKEFSPFIEESESITKFVGQHNVVGPEKFCLEAELDALCSNSILSRDENGLYKNMIHGSKQQWTL